MIGLRVSFVNKTNEVPNILAYSKANVIELQDYSNETIMLLCQSGRGAARLARLHGVQEVGGSNPLAPTNDKDPKGFKNL